MYKNHQKNRNKGYLKSSHNRNRKVDKGLELHDSLIHKTKKGLEDHLEHLIKNYEYKHGEVDLIGYKPKRGILYLFEMKKSYKSETYACAKKQINRAIKKLVPSLRNDGLNVNKIVPIFCSYHPRKKGEIYYHNMNLPIEPIYKRRYYK